MSEQIVHLVTDYDNVRHGKILTYRTVCEKWILPTWTTDKPAWVSCIECLQTMGTKKRKGVKINESA